jgi:primase-polymerase (primpol)-like protein
MFEEIPQELRELNQWVTVKAGSKVPLQSNLSRAASSSDPATWSSFEDAVIAVKSGYRDGIGFVFHNNGIVGIDIDKGFDDFLLTKETADIIQHCHSYTEKSRSGRGVHILVKGQLPFKGKNNRAGIEIYQDGRFFIMTGKVTVFDQIVENQEGIDYVLRNFFKEEEVRNEKGYSSRIYNPSYAKPGEKISLKRKYPRILPGSRNLSLASLAGQLHSAGYKQSQILKELLRCNSEACDPPLPRQEVEMIVRSITRY